MTDTPETQPGDELRQAVILLHSAARAFREVADLIRFTELDGPELAIAQRNAFCDIVHVVGGGHGSWALLADHTDRLADAVAAAEPPGATASDLLAVMIAGPDLDPPDSTSFAEPYRTAADAYRMIFEDGASADEVLGKHPALDPLLVVEAAHPENDAPPPDYVMDDYVKAYPDIPLAPPIDDLPPIVDPLWPPGSWQARLDDAAFELLSALPRVVTGWFPWRWLWRLRPDDLSVGALLRRGGWKEMPPSRMRGLPTLDGGRLVQSIVWIDGAWWLSSIRTSARLREPPRCGPGPALGPTDVRGPFDTPRDALCGAQRALEADNLRALGGPPRGRRG